MVGEHDAFIVRSQIETLAEKFAPDMEIRFLADLKADHMLLQNIPTLMASEITKNEDRRLSIAFDRGEGHLHVFLHGVENDGSFWNQVAFAVSSRGRAVSLDLLGFGQSPKPADIPYTVDDHIASIELTLDSLLRDADKPMTIVGHSIGGIIAAAFAAKHPTRVTRLVLFSVPINERDVAAGAGRLNQARAVFVDNFGPLRERGIKLSKNTAVRAVLGKDRLSRYLPTLRSLKNSVEVEQVGRDLSCGPRYSGHGRLRHEGPVRRARVRRVARRAARQHRGRAPGGGPRHRHGTRRPSRRASSIPRYPRMLLLK